MHRHELLTAFSWIQACHRIRNRLAVVGKLKVAEAPVRESRPVCSVIRTDWAERTLGRSRSHNHRMGNLVGYAVRRSTAL